MYLKTSLMCAMVLLALLSHIESLSTSMVGGEGRAGVSVVRGIRSARSPMDNAGATARDEDEDNDLYDDANNARAGAGCALDGGECDENNDKNEVDDERSCD